MRSGLAMLVLLFAAVAVGAADAPKATGTRGGKPVKFPEKGLADGVKATLGLLESCHDSSQFDADELKKALQGDHVQLVFPEPVTAEVLDKKVEFAELVFRLPIDTGVFWVRNGEIWRRYSKYEPKKVEAFEAWLRQAQPAD